MEKTRFVLTRLILFFITIFSLTLLMLATSIAAPSNDIESDTNNVSSSEAHKNDEVAKNESVEGLTILKDGSPAIINTDYTFNSTTGLITVLSPNITIIQNDKFSPLDYYINVIDAATVLNLTLVNLKLVHLNNIDNATPSIGVVFSEESSASKDFNLNISGTCSVDDHKQFNSSMMLIRGHGNSVFINSPNDEEGSLVLYSENDSLADGGAFVLDGVNMSINNIALNLDTHPFKQPISLFAKNNSTITMNGTSSLDTGNTGGSKTRVEFADNSSLVMNDYASISLMSDPIDSMFLFEGSQTELPVVLKLNDYSSFCVTSIAYLAQNRLGLSILNNAKIEATGNSKIELSIAGNAINAPFTDIDILENSSAKFTAHYFQEDPNYSVKCNNLNVDTNGTVVIDSNSYGLSSNSLNASSGSIYVDAYKDKAIEVASSINVDDNSLIYLTSGKNTDLSVVSTVSSPEDNFIKHEDNVNILGSSDYECNIFETLSETAYVYDSATKRYKINCVNQSAAKTVVIRSNTKMPEPYGLSISLNGQTAIPGEDYEYNPFDDLLTIEKPNIAICQNDHNELLHYAITSYLYCSDSPASLTLNNLNLTSDSSSPLNIFVVGQPSESSRLDLNISGNCQMKSTTSEPAISINREELSNSTISNSDVPAIVNINGLVNEQNINPSLSLQSSFNTLSVKNVGIDINGMLNTSIHSFFENSINVSYSPSFNINDTSTVDLKCDLGPALSSLNLDMMSVNDYSNLNAASGCNNAINLIDEEGFVFDNDSIYVCEDANMSISTGAVSYPLSSASIQTNRTINLDTNGIIEIKPYIPAAIDIINGDLLIQNGTLTIAQNLDYDTDTNEQYKFISVDNGNVIIGNSGNNNANLNILSKLSTSGIEAPEGSLSLYENSSFSYKAISDAAGALPVVKVKDFYEESTTGVSVETYSPGIEATNELIIKTGYLTLNTQGSFGLYSYGKIKINDSRSVYLTTAEDNAFAIKSNVNNFMENGTEIKMYGSKVAQTEPDDVVLPVDYYDLGDGTYTLAVQDEQSSNAPTPAKTILAKTEHDLDLVEGQAPTYNDAGWKDYYECTTCSNYYEDAAATMLIEDLDAWKTDPNGGYLPPYRIAFEQHRENILLACDNLLLPSDDDFIKVLIAEAKKNIDAYTYSDEISLDENKQELDKIYNKLVEDISNFRNQQQQSEEINAAAQTSDSTALLAVLILLLMSTTLFVANTKFNRSIK